MKKILTATVLAAVMLCIVRSSFAQDSLHLVMTLTGESYVKRITNAVGVGDVNGDGNADFLVSMPTSDRLRPYGVKQDFIWAAQSLTRRDTSHSLLEIVS